MNITAHVDNAIRVMAELGEPTGTPRPLGLLAEIQGISPVVLRQVLTELRRAKLVSVLRGSRGGYRLARPAESITIGEIIRAINGPWIMVGDTDATVLAYGGRAEQLPTLWLAIFASISEIVDSVTLKQLSGGRLPRRMQNTATNHASQSPRN